MGNYYTNITLAGPEAGALLAFLRAADRAAYVVSADRQTVVFDQATDEQNTLELEKLCRTLSDRFQCPALVVLNQDDQILWMQLFDRGQRLTEFNSVMARPSAADSLCRVFKRPAARPWVKLTLWLPFPFQIWRHALLVKLLGLPSCTVGFGYHYLARGGKTIRGLRKGDLTHTGITQRYEAGHGAPPIQPPRSPESS